ncbi:uncharacterized protein [Elaeis guineensis]|uniref:Uncharacterized protein LOC114913052 isoform X3 n=1 Tax=Elaeis guineensis var. tenera TaxID=51953 RepID=A0A8N4ERF2_ELAGV|nr:uncharacterized protein LOC114913052 isoform X3 [Elaeis guineensis]XP_029117429.1 uncharacterized protein LOC114913052 isoform X3 [Elaeis guineensis]
MVVEQTGHCVRKGLVHQIIHSSENGDMVELHKHLHPKGPTQPHVSLALLLVMKWSAVIISGVRFLLLIYLFQNFKMICSTSMQDCSIGIRY